MTTVATVPTRASTPPPSEESARAAAPPPAVLRVLLWPLDRVLHLVGPSYPLFIRLVTSTPPRLLAALGSWRAVRAADHARRRVPAYAAFLEQHGVRSADLRTLELPETDKTAYVTRWSLAERCVGGILPARATAIDESSGSTGTPYNWIRSLPERRTSHRFISHFTRYCFGDGPFIAINAFSMGAWATGVNMGVALQANGIVKSTGPDLDKVLSTIEFLGPDRPYLLCGYPPFLKLLLDTGRERGFAFERYRLMGLVGGEGMSEGLRDYLSPVFSPVYSGYGATDLEIGIAGETPLAVAIRRAAREDAVVRASVFGDDPRLPMVFQYNPLNHHVRVNDRGELVFTISRLEVLSPRIAYDIHDEGGTATFGQMGDMLRASGVRIRDLAAGGPRPLRLPFLWVYGRTDSTVSVMGANVYPEDVEQALYDEPDLAAVTTSFQLSLDEAADGSVRPCFSFELRTSPTDDLRRRFADRLTRRIVALNSDFRTAMDEHAGAVTPTVRLFGAGEGPFAADAGKIKQTRIVRSGATR
jgi:phenylacetate-CoA ligase